jgi:uncharacterized membrane protein
MTDWTGPDSYAAVLEALLVIAVIAAEIANIRWRARVHVHGSLQPTHTRANTLAWLGLLLSVLLLIGAFILSVKAPVQHDYFHRVLSSGLLVGLAYLTTLASALSIGRTAVRARRQSKTVNRSKSNGQS